MSIEDEQLDEQPLVDRRTYSRQGQVEAHLIADMLRIEGITNELREFKLDTKAKLNKLENWIVSIVGITVTTLIATVGSILLKVFS